MGIENLKAAVAQEHHDAINAAIAEVPEEHRGKVTDIFWKIVQRLQQLGQLGTIPWGKLYALIPLIAPAVITGDWMPLILAIIAMIVPVPTPGPAPAGSQPNMFSVPEVEEPVAEPSKSQPAISFDY
jgi:hypothetical protein